MARESHFHATWQSLGARFLEHAGWLVPEFFGDVRGEYAALRNGVGIFDLCYQAHILVRGEDALRFLHGMVSNDVKALAPGRGCYATILNPQGHLLADLYVFSIPDALLLETRWDLKNKVYETLDHYIIADQVELEDPSEHIAAIGLEGRSARALVKALFGDDFAAAENLSFSEKPLGKASVRVIKRSSAGGEGFALEFESEGAGVLAEKLGEIGGRFQARPVGLTALNIARVEAGIPWYGVDMVESTLVQEAGIENVAVSYTKGCYIGQEIVERVRSRGHVNRKLTGFYVDGTAQAGDKILDESKEVGHLTSVVDSFALNRKIALGYLRRELIEAGRKLKTASATLEVTPLPFWKT